MRKVDEIQAELDEVNKKAKSLEKELHKAKLREKRIFDDYSEHVKIGEIVKDKVFLIHYDGCYGGNKPYEISRAAIDDLIEYYKMKNPEIMMEAGDFYHLATYVVFDTENMEMRYLDMFRDTEYKESKVYDIENKLYWFLGWNDVKEANDEPVNYNPVFDKMYDEFCKDKDFVKLKKITSCGLPSNMEVYVKNIYETDIKPIKEFLK